MKTLIFTLIFILFFHSLSAQDSMTNDEFKWATDLIDEKSYLLFGPKAWYKDKDFVWLPGEGRKTILEAKIAGVYELWQSGLSHPDKEYKRRFKIALVGNVNLRLARDTAFTSPSVPPSNKIGLRFDFGRKYDSWESSTIFLQRIDAIHYSNGQAEENYIDSLGRYNLTNADFSTNYIRYTVSVNTSKQTITNKLIDKYASLSAGETARAMSNAYQSSYVFIQYDDAAVGKFGELLDYLPDDGNYGHWRAGLGYRFPFVITLTDNSMLWTAHLDFLYVFKKPTYDLPRFSGSYKLIWHPLKTAWGPMIFYHHGRDYMNIRYTVPVRLFGFGIHLENFHPWKK